MLNVDFMPVSGFEEGKFGVCVFLFRYAVYFQDQNIFDVASVLFEAIVGEINIHEPITFRRGLTGYGYGIISLITEEIMEAEDSEILSEINQQIFSRLDEVADMTNSDGLLGVGRYISAFAINVADKDLKNSQVRSVLDQISKKILVDNPVSGGKKNFIEFLVHMISLKINRDQSLSKLREIIVNSHFGEAPPSVLLENYSNSNIPLLKEAAQTMILDYHDMPDDRRSLHKTSLSLLETFSSVNYLAHYFPEQDFTESVAYWGNRLMSGPGNSIAGFDVDKELQNFRMFNGYANFGMELLKILTLNQN